MKLIYTLFMLFLVSAIAVSADLSVTGNVQLNYVKTLNTATTGTLTFTNTGTENIVVINQPGFIYIPGTTNVVAGSVGASDILFTLAPGAARIVTYTPSCANTPAGTYTNPVAISYHNESDVDAVNSVQSEKTISINVREAVHRVDVTSGVTLTGDLGKTITQTFTLTNSGDYGESLSITHNIDPKYSPVVTSSANLDKGASSTVSVRIIIPKTESVTSHSIGTVNIHGSNTDSNVAVTLDPIDRLDITNLKVKVDTKTQDDVTNEDTISKTAKPSSKVELDFELSNKYTDSEDVRINDAHIDVTVEGIDDGDDIEVDSDSVDISADNHKDIKLSFDVPTLVEDDTYTITIHAEGDNEDGITYNVDWNVYLKVEKDRHKVIIESASISPSSVTCSRNANVDVNVINIGQEDEDKVIVEVTSAGLNLDASKTFELYEGSDTDSEAVTSFSIPITDKTPAGTYPVDVNVYLGSSLKATEPLTLTVQECVINNNNNNNNNQNDNDDGFDVINPPASNNPSPIVVDNNDSFFNDNMALIILGAVVVILLIGVILLLFI